MSTSSEPESGSLSAPATGPLSTGTSGLLAAPPAGLPVLGRDAAWDGYHYVVVVGPLVAPDAERARRALARCADELAQLLLTRRDARTWVAPEVDLAEHLTRVVVTDPHLDGSTASAARVLEQPLDGLALRLTVGPEHVALHVDHVVGDGTAVYDLAPWLARTACTDEPGPPPSLASCPTPFRTALQHTFGSRPWSGAVRRTAVQVLAERRTHVATRPPTWDCRPSVEVAVDGGGGAEAMKRFRTTHAKGISSGMMTMAAVWWSLVEHSVVSPELRPLVGVDLRRYLPRRTPLFGNFTTCVRLPAQTPVHPVSLRDAIEEQASSGVPLLASSGQTVLASVRTAVPRPRRPRGEGQHHAAALVLNYMGRPPGWEKVPWQPGAARTLVNAPSTDSSRSLTVNICDMTDGPHITASFFDSVIPRAAVAAALDDVSFRLGDVLEAMQAAR